MVKGKATATVSGRVIAETDEYEFVEGNVYVSICYSTTLQEGAVFGIITDRDSSFHQSTCHSRPLRREKEVELT